MRRGLRDIARRLLRTNDLPGVLGALASKKITEGSIKAALDGIVHTETLKLTDGSEEQWDLCEPNLLLGRVIETCPALAEVYGQLANEHEPTPEDPWRLIVCFDEYTPGNKLKVDNRRKTMVLSYNFLDLGAFLEQDATWMSPVMVRTNRFKHVQGGWSAMLTQYLLVHLLGSHGLATAGAVVMVGGQPLHIFARLEVLMSDGDGLRMALSWRGANAVKPCFRHVNCVSKRSHIATFPGAAQRNIVDITCSDHRRFEKAKAGYLAGCAELANETQNMFDAERLGKGRYNEILRTPLR